MCNVIKLNNHQKSRSDVLHKRRKAVDLVLLSAFYFTDKFGSQINKLHTEMHYALAIMVYKYLEEAEKHGELEMTGKGFSLTTRVVDDLKRKIEKAISSENLRSFH